MADINTYNQVRHLASDRSSRSVKFAAYLAAAVAVTILLFVNSTTLLLALLLITLAVLLSIVIWYLAERRHPHCRFCGNQLAYIRRPFTFNEKYLAMPGVKDGDFFYTWQQRPYLPFLSKRPVRISKFSTACHTCRLIQQGHYVNHEVVSVGDLQEIMAKYPDHN